MVFFFLHRPTDKYRYGSLKNLREATIVLNDQEEKQFSSYMRMHSRVEAKPLK